MPSTVLAKALESRAHYSGRRGRTFESCHPDHQILVSQGNAGHGLGTPREIQICAKSVPNLCQIPLFAIGQCNG